MSTVGKLGKVAKEGPQVTEEDESQNIKIEVNKKCIVCLSDAGQLFSCVQCHEGCYCSKSCQKEDWNHHKKLCVAIATLEADKKTLDADRKVKRFDSLNFLTDTSLTPKEQFRLVKLIGEKCTVKC